MTNTRRTTLFGLPLGAMTMNEVVDYCIDADDSDKRAMIGVVNAAKIVSARKNPDLLDSLLACDLVVADGQSVVWASRILGQPLPERVAGIDLFERLIKVASDDRRSVYLLGATPEVLEKLQLELLKKYPSLIIAGARNGYFTEAESAEIAAEIRAANPDMLFLGMSSPKKEVFLRDWAADLGVPILHGVGGSFDVFAGVTKRAPDFMQRNGLEWFYRLIQEPRRLWRRYLSTNTEFIWLTLAERRSPTSPLHSLSSR